MRLSWKDGVATAIVALIVAVYLLFVNGTDLVFISGVRGATAVILVLGAIGCGYGAADELYKATESAARRTLAVVVTALGITALGAGLMALIFASEVALAVLFAATVALWLLATARHIAGTRRAPRVTGGATHPGKEAAAR